MMTSDNVSRPYVDIVISTGEGISGYDGIMHSLEENGIPFVCRYMETGHTDRSALGITVYAGKDSVKVYYEKYSENEPVFSIYVKKKDTSSMIYRKARIIGNNIAGLIKIRRFEIDMDFRVCSTAVKDGRLQDKYGDRCDSSDMISGIPQISFPVSWSGTPEGTQSFAVVFMDYDNSESEGFPFVHWTVCGIPADVDSLEEDCGRKGGPFIQGRNSWYTIFGPYEYIPEELTLRFGGPAPGDVEHEYEFTVYALDIIPDLKAGFFFNELRKAMRGHILAEDTLYAMY